MRESRSSRLPRLLAAAALGLAIPLVRLAPVHAGNVPVNPPAPSVVITEFLAANQNGLRDENGETSDWIELHNPTDAPVDLAGWSLTDDARQPARWRLPERTLAPGEYLVVFASGKNRTGPGPLHTNFRLETSGEYLGLFQPDGTTVATEFRPAFPPQEPDRSYAVPAFGQATERLAGAPIAILIPSAAADLPADWAMPDGSLGPQAQSAVGLALGFDPTPAGPGPDLNLARAGTASQSSTGFGMGPENAIDGDPETFTHTASDDDQSAWTLDLGAAYEIRRVILRNRTSCCQSRLRDITVRLLAEDGRSVLWASELLNPEDSLGSPAALTLDLFELNIDPPPARYVAVARTPDPDLSGSGGLGNADEDNVLSLGEVEVYGTASASFAPWIRTDLKDSMPGRNSSVFVRALFVLEEPVNLSSLRLRVRHDDGLVIHLNGQPIASFNAPAVPSWNSSATTRRETAGALAWLDLDLEPFRSLWLAGTNWLAFQGLNAAVDDLDYFLEAHLVAVGQAPAGFVFLTNPTPGAPNEGAWDLGRVADTRFSVDRGFFAAPFDLEISTATPGAAIRYTTDGSTPTADQGLLYTGPLRISRTTLVRAAAFKPDFRPTNVDTHSYLFLEDIVNQPPRPAGFPSAWAGVAADYAMDPRITQAPAYAGRVREGLLSLPTVSLVTPVANLFDANRGIYANPERNGLDWERPVSVEWLEPGGSDAFQLDAGLRIQGGYFRQRGVTRKHSLRLLFKEIYGPGRLRRDLFREFGAARDFDTLVLRAGANDGYSWDAARDTEQFVRDEFGRRLLLDMGQPSPRGAFVHLYLNGLYWGLYNLTERPAEDFSASYLGGDAAHWDAINSGEVKNGSLDAWNAFMAMVRTAGSLADYQRLKGLNADGSPNPAYPAYFDAPNYIDYFVANVWGGNWDWPNKNFWFGRERAGRAGGFKFYAWDFENTMGNNRDRSPLAMVSPRPEIASSWVGEPHFRLRANPEYRLEFADRLQRHIAADGVLTPEFLLRRYRDLASRVETAIAAESARWGDDHFQPPQDPSDWERERDWMLGTYLPQRTAIVLDQWRAAGLYPRTPAPRLNPPGGRLATNVTPTLTAAASELFYTTNGLDPRLPGGAIRPGALRFEFAPPGPQPNPDLVRSGQEWRYLADGSNPGPNWMAPDFDDRSWPSGPSPLGYGDGDETTVVGFVDANPNLAGIQKNATTLFRRAFEVVSPADYETLRLNLTYDDAAAVYLNGQRIAQTENLPPGAALETYASSTSPDNAVLTRTDLSPGLLRPGRNVLAVEIHQSDASSSDISFDLELFGSTSAPAVTHVVAVPLPPGVFQVRARAREGADWSALTEALFVVDQPPATPASLVVSKLGYRPIPPSTDAERAVSGNREDFEFLELLNVSSASLDLGGARFTSGILYTFPMGSTLAPGGRLLLVGRRAAFEARYGTTLPLAGEFDGRLDNAGERLVLVDAAGQILQDFTYLDSPPWPSLPDNEGVTLVLVRPESRPDPANPANWRLAASPLGSPGRSDATPFVGEPGADLNGNGRPDLLDYALGIPEGDAPAALTAAVETFLDQGILSRTLIVAHPRQLSADEALVVLEMAPSVQGPWRREPRDFVLISDRRLTESTILRTFRVASAPRDGANTFVRLIVEPRP